MPIVITGGSEETLEFAFWCRCGSQLTLEKPNLLVCYSCHACYRPIVEVGIIGMRHFLSRTCLCGRGLQVKGLNLLVCPNCRSCYLDELPDGMSFLGYWQEQYPEEPDLLLIFGVRAFSWLDSARRACPHAQIMLYDGSLESQANCQIAWDELKGKIPLVSIEAQEFVDRGIAYTGVEFDSEPITPESFAEWLDRMIKN